MATLSDFSRTIPQRLQATYAPVGVDTAFDDVLARLARAFVPSGETDVSDRASPQPCAGRYGKDHAEDVRG